MEIFSTAAASAAAPAVSQPAAPGPGRSTDPADPGAAAYFSTSMSTQPVVQAPRARAIDAVDVSGKAPAMGDRILGSLQALGDNYRAIKSEVYKTLDATTGFSASELLKLQFHMGNASVLVTAVSGVANRVTQSVDQLTKLQ